MNDDAGTSSQVISAPSGGGALSGLGEKFSPDLYTGTGNFTVPIRLPPGRNGFQPELALVYSTGNGNGPFGLGWSLSVPGVHRRTSKGVPVYDNEEDTFVLSGAEDLVPVETAGARIRYRPRTEGLFARITHHHDVGNDYWEVRSKDGLTSVYGTPRPDDAGTDWLDPAVIADPANRDKVFAWKLTETRDPFGNRIVYGYERDTAQEGPRQWDQLYLKQIRYADYEHTEAPQEQHFLISATFVYEDEFPSGAPERPDAFSQYRSGFEIRTRRRCKRIEIRTHADPSQPALTRTHDFVYFDEHETHDELPLNGVSLLSRIQVTGHDSIESEQLPPLEFGYSRFRPKEERDFLPFVGELPTRSLANADLEMADLTGDGLPDIFEMAGGVRYWSNLGGGRFDLPREMREAPAGVALADPDVQLIDADGDARVDLMVSRNGLSGYFPLRHDGEWDRRFFRRYRHAPSFNLLDPEVQLVDLDGDGVTDAIRSGTRLECFFNDPEEGWNDTRFVSRRDIEDFPNVNFSDPRVKFADMTGDGLQDIVLVYDGNVEYWPNLGRGNWGRRIHMENSPRFPYGYDPRRILVGDVDGDGTADLVYVDHCKVTLWVNRSGNGWNQPIEIDGTPPGADQDSLRLVDALGTGIRGVLWSKNRSGNGRPHLFFLDFTGQVKPYLLNQMDNHLGAVTRVAYEPSTRFYQDDRLKRRPWKTSLPFPVQVVSRVEVIDEISGGKLTTEYKYHHGYWDGAEREFRGFGMVEQLDTETFEAYLQPGLHGEDATFEAIEAERFSPPTLTKSWFHQGPVEQIDGEWEELDWSREFWPGDPSALQHRESLNRFLHGLPERQARRDALRSLRGVVLRTELYALDGSERKSRPYTVTEHSYGVREENPPSETEEGRRRIFFPHSLAQRTTQWERGDEPMTQFAFTEDYDAYGQSRSQVSIAAPRGRDFRVMTAPREHYLATHTEIEYAYKDSDNVYIVDRVARTTTREIQNDGSAELFNLKADAVAGIVPKKIIGQELRFYDSPAFTGLPLGDIDRHGALMRIETLVLDEAQLSEAYPGGDPILTDSVPPYFMADASPSWPSEYPSAFVASRSTASRTEATRPGLTITPLGYGTAHAGVEASFEPNGYYVASQRLDYDARGLPVARRDPLGSDAGERDLRIEYDAFGLLPVKVTDAVGLETTVDYDYRVLKAKRIVDPNGGEQEFSFSPLGLTAAIFTRGREGEGDHTEPSVRFEYDLRAFERSPFDGRRPVWVRAIRHEQHDDDPDASAATITTMEYSDGFGRRLQTRTQADDLLWGHDAVFGNGVLPADQTDANGTRQPVAAHERAEGDPPNVVASGWTTYDNKGRVVEQYEPFFARGWDYLSRQEAVALRDGGGADLFGQKLAQHYDPRGQVVRTVNPDGSEERVIYGRPTDLHQLDRFEPTPWEVYTYDSNDNAGRTHRSESAGYAHHWNTPASIEIDALGRIIRAVRRSRGPDPGDPIEAIESVSTYDIQGNLLSVTDGLGREAFSYTYDLAGQRLRIESIDAGSRRIVLDAASNEVERRDSKLALVLQEYDRLNRSLRIWFRDAAAGEVTLRQRLVYGDEGDRAAARSVYRLGRIHQHYDEAGRVAVERYDFKGNVLEKQRRVIRDDRVADCFTQAGINDWQAGENELLESDTYVTSTAYDALNRVVELRYPQDVEGNRAQLRPRYNRAGALQSVTLDGQAYVERITYNAKGQRAFIAYGNGLWTRYAYHPETCRLARLHTGKYLRPEEGAFKPDGGVLQDLAYRYDLAGNVLAIDDRSPDAGVGGAAELNRNFEYDPLYRLTQATGREHHRNQQPFPVPLWRDAPTSQDATATRAYAQSYAYDAADSLTRLDHRAGPRGSFVRRFSPATDSNQLASLDIGQESYAYVYDPNGNLIQESASRHFGWNHSDQLISFRVQAGEGDPSVQAFYLYDAAGQRVKKLVRKNHREEATIYIDGLFEHHRWRHGSEQGRNDQLHVMDEQSRIALVRRGPAHPDDAGPAARYHLGDHLGSSSLVVSDEGRWTNREEYYPYGETSYGSFARKRYRFTGMERDEESGLNYHGARYYVPYLCRWCSSDPNGARAGLNLYAYANVNPENLTDRNGRDPNEESEKTNEFEAANKADKVEAEAFDKAVGHLKDPQPAPRTNEEKARVHDVKTIEHDEKVATVVNTALELSVKRHTDPETGELTATKYEIASHAKSIVVDWRNNSKENVNNLVFRDADHYLTGYTQEWQKHLPNVTNPENNRLTSDLSDAATSYYNEKKELHFKIAAMFDPEGVETFDSGLEPFDENNPPPSAPGGSRWPALGAEHFRRDFDSLGKHEAPQALPLSPFQYGGNASVNRGSHVNNNRRAVEGNKRESNNNATIRRRGHVNNRR